jgi:hypothetical protein
MKYIFPPRSYWSERAGTGWVGGGEAFSFPARPRSVCSSIGGVSIPDVVHLCFLTSEHAMAGLKLTNGTTQQVLVTVLCKVPLLD